MWKWIKKTRAWLNRAQLQLDSKLSSSGSSLTWVWNYLKENNLFKLALTSILKDKIGLSLNFIVCDKLEKLYNIFNIIIYYKIILYSHTYNMKVSISFILQWSRKIRPKSKNMQLIYIHVASIDPSRKQSR